MSRLLKPDVDGAGVELTARPGAVELLGRVPGEWHPDGRTRCCTCDGVADMMDLAICALSVRVGLCGFYPVCSQECRDRFIAAACPGCLNPFDASWRVKGDQGICAVCWNQAGCSHIGPSGKPLKVGEACVRPLPGSTCCGFAIPVGRPMTEFEERCAVGIVR